MRSRLLVFPVVALVLLAVAFSIVTGYRPAKDGPPPGVVAIYAGGGGGPLCGTPTTPECPLS